MSRIWRSMLYVPANVPRFVEKSATSGADAILLDLEDSVPMERKAEARSALAAAVPIARSGGAEVLVRVNRPMRLVVGDIEAAVEAGADGILLTKVMGPDHVQLAAELLAGAPRPMRMVVMIETAAAMQRINEIARASPLIAGIVVGAEDLAAECGAAPDDELIMMAKRQMVLAAVAAGIAPLGTLGTVADYKDPERIRALVARSKRAGLVGASCIHPSLVAILNEGFSPSAAEVDLARRHIAAGEVAAREGRGSFVVDGMMVDEPILIRARRTLALAG